jgi:hypothetical protein
MGKNFITTTIALTLLFGSLEAQVLTTSDVLATAASDLQLMQNRSLQELAQGLKVHDPLLRQVSVQLGINGSALGDTIYGYIRNEDDYRLRVEFNSWFEREKQRRVHASKTSVIAARNRLLEHEALARRYKALAAYLFVQPHITACQDLDSLLKMEHHILREMLSSGVQDLKVSKVLDAEEDQNRNDLTLQELENRKALYTNRLQQLAGSIAAVDTADLIDLTGIRAKVIRLKSAPAAHPTLAVKSAEIAAEDANLQYINSQNRQVFNFAQVGYQHPLYLERPNKFNTFNNFSFRVGLTAPMPANNRFRKANALLNLREAQNEETSTSAKLLEDLENQYVKLENFFREYDLLQDRIENSLIQKMLDNPVLKTQITPLEWVELEIAQQKMRVSRAALEFDIAMEYVELLDLSGAMSAMPRVNYLKGGF